MQLTLFENEVELKPTMAMFINSDLAEYNKKARVFIKYLKKNITGTDKKNNVIKAEFAQF